MKTSRAAVAVYLRVSTLDQESGIKSQEKALREYAEGHGLKVKVYRDRLSGASTDRPAFNRLQQDIFNGRIKTVIVWKLDRLSRTLRDGLNVLTDWLEKDVRVISVTQQFDFSGSIGQLLASVFFALAQMERENLRENTKRGMAAAKARGAKIGKRARLKASEIAAAIKDGESMVSIAKRYRTTPQGLYACLKREGVSVHQLRNPEQSK